MLLERRDLKEVFLCPESLGEGAHDRHTEAGGRDDEKGGKALLAKVVKSVFRKRYEQRLCSQQSHPRVATAPVHS